MTQATSYPQILGQVIRGYRELQGVSLEMMATAMGFQSRSGWSRVESGDTTMNASQIRKAARYLNRQPWTVLKDTDNLAMQLEAAGIEVHDEKPKDHASWFLGGAAILAVVAGAAAAASVATAATAPTTRRAGGRSRRTT